MGWAVLLISLFGDPRQAAQHADRPRLLTRTPPGFRLRGAPGADDILSVGPGDDPLARRVDLAHGSAGAVQPVEALVNAGEVAHALPLSARVRPSGTCNTRRLDQTA
jgi:hypothetical protein